MLYEEETENEKKRRRKYGRGYCNLDLVAMRIMTEEKEVMNLGIETKRGQMKTMEGIRKFKTQR